MSFASTRVMNAGLAGLLGCLLVVGCSGSGERSSGTDSRGDAVEQSAALLDAQAADARRARKQVELTRCRQTRVGWSAVGTVRNTDSAVRRFVVTVYFADKAGATVNFATTAIELESGATEKWSASKRFEAPQRITCTIAGVTSEAP